MEETTDNTSSTPTQEQEPNTSQEAEEQQPVAHEEQPTSSTTEESHPQETDETKETQEKPSATMVQTKRAKPDPYEDSPYLQTATITPSKIRKGKREFPKKQSEVETTRPNETRVLNTYKHIKRPSTKDETAAITEAMLHSRQQSSAQKENSQAQLTAIRRNKPATATSRRKTRRDDGVTERELPEISENEETEDEKKPLATPKKQTHNPSPRRRGQEKEKGGHGTRSATSMSKQTTPSSRTPALPTTVNGVLDIIKVMDPALTVSPYAEDPRKVLMRRPKTTTAIGRTTQRKKEDAKRKKERRGKEREENGKEKDEEEGPWVSDQESPTRQPPDSETEREGEETKRGVKQTTRTTATRRTTATQGGAQNGGRTARRPQTASWIKSQPLPVSTIRPFLSMLEVQKILKSQTKRGEEEGDGKGKTTRRRRPETERAMEGEKREKEEGEGEEEGAKEEEAGTDEGEEGTDEGKSGKKKDWREEIHERVWAAAFERIKARMEAENLFTEQYELRLSRLEQREKERRHDAMTLVQKKDEKTEQMKGMRQTQTELRRRVQAERRDQAEQRQRNNRSRTRRVRTVEDDSGVDDRPWVSPDREREGDGEENGAGGGEDEQNGRYGVGEEVEGDGEGNAGEEAEAVHS